MAHVVDHDIKVDRLVSAIETRIAQIPGVTGLQLVEKRVDELATHAVWGFDYEGVPSSLMWNVTP